MMRPATVKSGAAPKPAPPPSAQACSRPARAAWIAFNAWDVSAARGGDQPGDHPGQRPLAGTIAQAERQGRPLLDQYVVHGHRH